MADALKKKRAKRTDDVRILRRRGLIIMLLVLVIGVAGYFVFPFRINQKRIGDLYLSKAKVAARHDKYDDAAVALQKASMADPGNLQIQTEKLKVDIFKIIKQYDAVNRLINFEKLDQAEADCNRLLQANPGSAEVTALLGIIYAHKDQPRRAFETYQKASEMDPAYANVRNYWGRTAVQWQFPDNWREFATQKYNEARQLDPTYPSPLINLVGFQVADAVAAPTSFQTQYLQTAVDTLWKSEEIGKNNEFFYAAWGSALDVWGKALRGTNKIEAYKKFSAALEKYRIAENINPNVALVHFNKADILEDLSSGSDRAEEAIAEYTKALELQPGLIEAHVAIARVLMKRSGSDPESLQKARDRYKQAIDLTTQTIEQYKVRKSRTTDVHAIKMLDIWTKAGETARARLVEELRQVDSQPTDTTRSGIAK
jgi:tetratricopeptide (TPR) repeat protein